jgi:ribosome-binding factor A
MRKVDEGIRQVLSEAIPALKDPRIGYGSEKTRAATLRALEGAVGVLQARVGRELRLRRTPHLAFVYDRAVEHGVAMTKLIDELAPTDETDEQPS